MNAGANLKKIWGQKTEKLRSVVTVRSL